nr:MAG TPA: hypothetical protein [Caudoviricetes sp.]
MSLRIRMVACTMIGSLTGLLIICSPSRRRRLLVFCGRLF